MDKRIRDRTIERTRMTPEQIDRLHIGDHLKGKFLSQCRNFPFYCYDMTIIGVLKTHIVYRDYPGHTLSGFLTRSELEKFKIELYEPIDTDELLIHNDKFMRRLGLQRFHLERLFA